MKFIQIGKDLINLNEVYHGRIVKDIFSDETYLKLFFKSKGEYITIDAHEEFTKILEDNGVLIRKHHCSCDECQEERLND